MKFRYRSIISLDFEQGTPFLLMRPEIPVTVIGSRGSVTYSALVDTGADNVVFPRSVADELGIELHPSERCQATGFGGGTVSLLSGQATLEIGDAQERLAFSSMIANRSKTKSFCSAISDSWNSFKRTSTAPKAG